VAPDLDATLLAHPMSATRAGQAGVVKSTKRRATSCALASLMREFAAAAAAAAAGRLEQTPSSQVV